MRVALATCAALPADLNDDRPLADALRARGVDASFEVWDDPAADWDSYDLVVIRSTWDYTRDRDAFLGWASSLDGRLRNPPPLVRWNSDKRYLADLAAAGVPTTRTRFAAPGDPAPELRGEVVVKPSVSAGGRHTGRFAPAAHGEARALLERIRGGGRTAMVQPFLQAVETEGEAAVVFVAGEPSHVLRKRAVLRPDEIAPMRPDGVGAAEAMYDPGLVEAGEADRAQRELAAAVVAHVAERFGAAPLYARVDMVRRDDGEPVVLELEAIEPCLYLAVAPGAAERLADAVLAEL